jgi:hypothetical protein
MRVLSRAWTASAAFGLAGAIGSTAMAQNAALPPLPLPPGEDTAAPSTPPPLAATPLDVPPKPPAQNPVSAHPSPGDPAQPDGASPDATVVRPRPPDPWETRPFMVEAHLGIGTPVGLVGIAFDYSPWALLGLNLGVGLGVSGPEYAFTSRVRLLRVGRRTRVALYLGAGVSGGSYDQPTALDSFPVDGSQTESASDSAHFHWAMATGPTSRPGSKFVCHPTCRFVRISASRASSIPTLRRRSRMRTAACPRQTPSCRGPDTWGSRSATGWRDGESAGCPQSGTARCQRYSVERSTPRISAARCLSPSVATSTQSV